MQKKRVVLVVEDDDALRYLAQRQLKVIGVDCDVATDGLQAVAKSQQQMFDLIFMDLQMPNMDGLEATRIIRQKEAELNLRTYVPIIALTANSERQRCYDAGMNDFLFKPVSIVEMQKMIVRWVAN